MSAEVLEKLDTQIRDAEKAAADAEAKAQEKRDSLTGSGGDIPEPGTPEFKAATDELAETYKTVDEQRDIATGLKGQRVIVARTLGEPAPDVGGEMKGIGAEELASYIAAAKGVEVDEKTFEIGTRIVESDQYKAALEAGKFEHKTRIGTERLGKAMDKREFKDLISGAGTGAFKDPMRTPYEPLKQRATRLLELVQTIPTSQESVKYAQMTVAGHNVKIIADPTSADVIDGEDVTEVMGGVKPESSYTFAVKTAEVETLAHTLPIHRNQLKDVEALEAILNDEMERGLLLFLESEIIAGTGGSDHLLGILNQSGIVNQPIGSDSLIVAQHKALTGCRLLFEEPTLWVMHPNDWQTIRLLRDNSGGAGTGGFLFGPPSQAGDATLWGLPVITTPVVPAGRPLCGDFSAAQLYLREGVSILASDSHADFFIRNLIMLLAEMRAGFGVRRPGAFGKVTV